MTHCPVSRSYRLGGRDTRRGRGTRWFGSWSALVGVEEFSASPIGTRMSLDRPSMFGPSSCVGLTGVGAIWVPGCGQCLGPWAFLARFAWAWESVLVAPKAVAVGTGQHCWEVAVKLLAVGNGERSWLVYRLARSGGYVAGLAQSRLARHGIGFHRLIPLKPLIGPIWWCSSLLDSARRPSRQEKRGGGTARGFSETLLCR